MKTITTFGVALATALLSLPAQVNAHGYPASPKARRRYVTNKVVFGGQPMAVIFPTLLVVRPFWPRGIINSPKSLNLPRWWPIIIIRRLLRPN
jgi:hypothetical protein